jgi:hypothetical protein
MSGMVSKWPVLVSLPIAPDDLDDEGALVRDAAERLFARARDVYFARCRTVDVAALEVLEVDVRPGGADVGSGEVTVSVSVVEVFPDRFTMNARIRPAAGEGIAADAWCSLSAGEVSAAMRDEFIGLAHGAAHYH